MANLYFQLDFREKGPKNTGFPSMHISLKKLIDEMYITNECVTPEEIESHANKMISELEKIKKDAVKKNSKWLDKSTTK